MFVLQQILSIFHKTFLGSTATLLIGGAREPLYIPASAIFPYHRIFFVRDSVSSALHEISHWCIAGSRRRTLIDYGYWYTSDERKADEQMRFIELEITPQALEAIFHEDLDLAFQVSLDSFHSDSEQWREPFSKRVHELKTKIRHHGLNGRAGLFSESLRSASVQSRHEPLSLASN